MASTGASSAACTCAGWESSEEDEDVCTCGHNYDMHSGSGECQSGRD